QWLLLSIILPKMIPSVGSTTVVYLHENCCKQVSQRQPIYSARVNLNHRVLGLLESDSIYWYWIGAHDEYDELLKRM
ncbi:MAG: hypothetical protein V7K24_11195, partial [Nostoc sp.]